jgi:hypothetical protein
MLTLHCNFLINPIYSEGIDDEYEKEMAYVVLRTSFYGLCGISCSGS